MIILLQRCRDFLSYPVPLFSHQFIAASFALGERSSLTSDCVIWLKLIEKVLATKVI